MSVSICRGQKGKVNIAGFGFRSKKHDFPANGKALNEVKINKYRSIPPEKNTVSK